MLVEVFVLELGWGLVSASFAKEVRERLLGFGWDRVFVSMVSRSRWVLLLVTELAVQWALD